MSATSDDDPLSALFSGLAVDAPPAENSAVPPKVALRDYQAALLADADALFQGGERAVLAYLPTGGGKTRVGAAAMAEWALSATPSARSG